MKRLAHTIQALLAPRLSVCGKKLFLIAALVVIPTQSILAQNKAGIGDIKLVHVAPDISTMPNPGLPFKLSVRAVNTKRTTDPMILVGTKDGIYYEATSKRAYLNERDVSTYEFEIPAPLAELRYRFVLYPSASEQPIPSQQEVLRRSCIPKIALADNLDEPTNEGNERMKRLLVASKALEYEVGVLDSTVDAAQDLQSLIGQKDQAK